MRACRILTLCIGVAVQALATLATAQAQDAAVVFRQTFDAPTALAASAAVSGTWDVSDGVLVNGEAGGGCVLVGRRSWRGYACTVRMRTLRPSALWLSS